MYIWYFLTTFRQAKFTFTFFCVNKLELKHTKISIWSDNCFTLTQNGQRTLVSSLQHRIPRFGRTHHHHTRTNRHPMPVLRENFHVTWPPHRTSAQPHRDTSIQMHQLREIVYFGATFKSTFQDAHQRTTVRVYGV